MLQVERDKVSGELLGITSEFRNRKRGVETKLILENAAGPRDKTLFRNIAPAHRYFDKILDGQKNLVKSPRQGNCPCFSSGRSVSQRRP